MLRITARVLLVLVVALLAVSVAQPQEDAPVVTLEGFAVLPADTFAEGPQSGTAIEAANDRTPPFDGQPVQGVSAILPGDEAGTWLIMSDNGFGSKGNSPDYILRVYTVAVDFEAGSVEVVDFIQLRDPNNVIPFPITNEDTEERLLTGSDFDLESFRRLDDGTFYFGEEFGPFLLHTDADGVVLEAPIPTPYPSVLEPWARGRDFVQAAQNPDFFGMSDEEANAMANHRTSRGFEGMALNTSGTFLYPLLEGALFDDPVANRLLLQEFDIEAGAYTDRFFFYVMDSPSHAIGDMTAINDEEFLVIERDGNQGEEAAFKRIYRINLSEAGPDGFLPKHLVADLLNISDPNGITQPEEGAIGFGETFTFPFVTIEAVWPIDADTLVVTNDNNYPFSSGRRPGVAPDNNEFILIGLPEPLNLAE